jgi:hypothetical protein
MRGIALTSREPDVPVALMVMRRGSRCMDSTTGPLGHSRSSIASLSRAPGGGQHRFGVKDLNGAVGGRLRCPILCAGHDYSGMLISRRSTDHVDGRQPRKAPGDELIAACSPHGRQTVKFAGKACMKATTTPGSWRGWYPRQGCVVCTVVGTSDQQCPPLMRK